MQLTSSAFGPNGAIPAKYTCDGEDLSPPLAWADLPAGTQAVALLVDDPDAPDPKAPKKVWVHWIAYNLPPIPPALPEGAGNRGPTAPARYATTDAGKAGYHGPCPPIGRHRYFFRLFALDAPLKDLGADARRADFEAALSGHVLGTAVLMGTYAHPGNG
jgi:Raf kinase inhibitor-like YbhB/YbcL family protein